MAAKLVSLQSDLTRHLSSVFNDYQDEIRDLLLAINVVRLALEAEEDSRAQRGTARVALEHLEDMATELNTKWHDDYASLGKYPEPLVISRGLATSARNVRFEPKADIWAAAGRISSHNVVRCEL